MIFSRIVSNRAQVAFLPLLLCLLSIVFLPGSAKTAEKGTSKTGFLPLSITGAGELQSLQSEVDAQLSEALASTNVLFIAREEAAAMANYKKTWPPPTGVLRSIAEKNGLDNIATGTLTAVGTQISIDVKLFDLLSPTTPKYYSQIAQSGTELHNALVKIAVDIDNYVKRDFLIASITPEGNNRIDSGAILRQIETKPGDPYNQATLRNDLKKIFQMGYFNDARIDVRDTAQGKQVVFKVTEKPMIQDVKFEGISELKEDDVKAAANIKPNFILNPVKLSAAEEAMTQLYKTKGYYNSKITTKITYPDNNGALVTFKIDEGEKIYIKKISVEGNVTFKESELLDEIDTSEKWFMSWLTDGGLLDMDKIKQDSQKIVAFYNNHGFLDAKIGEPQISQDKEWLYVKFVVEEGTRYKVGTVEVKGDLIADKTKILGLLQIRQEEYLSRQIIRDDIMKLTDFYAESGFAFASVKPHVEKAPSGNRMDITFNIGKGNLVYIDRITIKGNTRTRDNVIRRELRIAEGGVFDSKAIRESTQALQRLMFFEEVNITPEPSLDPNRMNIIITVKEKNTGSFSVGAGYSTADKLIFTGQIAENNFLGRGDTLALTGTISGVSNRYNLGYTNPHLLDSPMSWGADLFSTYREYDDYTKESKGGGLRVGYPIFEKWRIYGNYTFTDTDLTDVSDDASYIIRNSVDLHITSAMSVSLVRDTRDKKYGASNGTRNALSVEYAGGPFGGDAQFTKVEGSSSWYHPLFLGTVFHIKGAAGQVFENQTDKLPVYERFYLGGLSSIRGFKYGKVSPIDPDSGERIGGDKMWYSNVEFIFPLLEAQGLRGLFFYDTGQVLNDDQDWGSFSEDLKKATGVGINWLSPMGPLNLVWGYNLDPLDDEDDAVWDFSIGGTF